MELVDSGHVVGCFDKRAVMARTYELSAARSDIVVGLAVRSCSELSQELKIHESGQIGSCYFV